MVSGRQSRSYATPNPVIRLSTRILWRRRRSTDIVSRIVAELSGDELAIPGQHGFGSALFLRASRNGQSEHALYARRDFVVTELRRVQAVLHETCGIAGVPAGTGRLGP